MTFTLYGMMIILRSYFLMLKCLSAIEDYVSPTHLIIGSIVRSLIQMKLDGGDIDTEYLKAYAEMIIENDLEKW
jgi:hypothetical protein